jgi:hypothetical protein
MKTEAIWNAMFQESTGLLVDNLRVDGPRVGGKSK